LKSWANDWLVIGIRLEHALWGLRRIDWRSCGPSKLLIYTGNGTSRRQISSLMAAWSLCLLVLKLCREVVRLPADRSSSILTLLLAPFGFSGLPLCSLSCLHGTLRFRCLFLRFSFPQLLLLSEPFLFELTFLLSLTLGHFLFLSLLFHRSLKCLGLRWLSGRRNPHAIRWLR